MKDCFQIKAPSGNLAAELVLPDAFDREKDRCTLLILMHGFLGGKEKSPMDFVSKALVEGGYAILRFDFDGYGASDGAQEDNTIPKMIQDSKAVWDYASSLPFVHRIVILGHSQGGVVAGILAGRLEKAGTPPAALILMAPASILRDYARSGKFFAFRCDPKNPPKWISVTGYKIGREYILSAQTLPIEEDSSCFTGPVCLLHGTWDMIIPISCSESYYKLYRHCEFHRIKGAGHVFLLRHQKVRDILLAFLQKYCPRNT
jgi:hypothetical protein